MTDWTHVSKKNPCPVCGKGDWCLIGKAMVLCNRVVSPKPAKGGGYYHPLGGRVAAPAHRPAAKPKAPSINCPKILAAWASQMPAGALGAYAGSLGVSEAALVSLGAVYAPQHRAWAFPMRDGYGNRIGIRLRADDGRKWAVTGSRQGLFLPPSLACRVYICEGPTDTAAALTMGLCALGRPSCNGGAADIRIACKRANVREVVIVADHDADKVRPTGELWNPGQDGAAKLAEELKMRFKIWTPSAKDVRAWLRLGGSRALVEEHLNNLSWE